jgi:acetyl esterase/lipase
MPRVLRLASLLLIVVASAVCGEESGSPFRQPRFEVRSTSAIVYGRAAVHAPQPGEKDLLLDLYEPVGANTPRLRPAFVAIHGGGFKNGSRSAGVVAELCRELAARGFVCVSIDYRMLGDDPPTEGGTAIERAIHAAVADAGTAVNWLVENAKKHQVDAGRIAIGGGSAGAITSLMLTYRQREDGAGKPPIAAVVDLWGSLYQASGHIQAGAPPVLIVHGTEDRIVDFRGAEDISRRCREVGVTCELYAIQGAAHGVPLSREYNGVPLMQRVINFLDTQLRLAELAG